jgi:hypothetical protein
LADGIRGVPATFVQLELHSRGQTLLAGAWDLHVEFNGSALRVDSPWQQVCWITDDKSDHLELEISLTGGLRVQRQMLLCRADRFLYLADAVLGRRTGQIEYHSTLPLASGAEAAFPQETRECLVSRGKHRAAVLPLALPEWQRDPRGGRLTQSAAGLEHARSAQGRTLYAPLFIDLNPRRAQQPLTWRQLTVAEERVILPADLAVGYRAQIGRQQWVFYRSLGPKGNRTVLGCNLITEFLAARFSREGKVETLVEVE